MKEGWDSGPVYTSVILDYIVVQLQTYALFTGSQNLNLNHLKQALFIDLDCHHGYWAQILEVSTPQEFLT